MVGSLSVARLLLDNDLVDELTLLTYPVVVGQPELDPLRRARSIVDLETIAVCSE